MKTTHKALKNICKKHPFLQAIKYIENIIPETLYLSGVPPSLRGKIQVERAVNMPKFHQFENVLQ